MLNLLRCLSPTCSTRCISASRINWWVLDPQSGVTYLQVELLFKLGTRVKSWHPRHPETENVEKACANFVSSSMIAWDSHFKFGLVPYPVRVGVQLNIKIEYIYISTTPNVCVYIDISRRWWGCTCMCLCACVFYI